MAERLNAILLCIFVSMFVAVWWGVRELFSGRSLIAYRPAREVPWNGRSMLAVLSVWLILNIVVVVAWTRLYSSTGPLPAKSSQLPLSADASKPKAKSPSFSLKPSEQMQIATITNVLILIAIPTTLFLTCGASLDQIGFSTVRFVPNIGLGYLFFLLITPLIQLIFLLAVLIWPVTKHPLEEMLRKELSNEVAILAIVSAVIFAPLSEELMFRGVLQGWLTKVFRRLERRRLESFEPNSSQEKVQDNGYPQALAEREAIQFEHPGAAHNETDSSEPSSFDETRPSDRAGENWAIVVTSVIFALLHASAMPAPIPLFVLSLLLGVLASRSGSLVPSIVLHACFNGFSTLALFTQVYSKQS